MYEPIEPVQSTTNTRSRASGCVCVFVFVSMLMGSAAVDAVEFADAGLGVSAGTSGVVSAVVGAGEDGDSLAVVVEDAFPMITGSNLEAVHQRRQVCHAGLG